MTKQHMLNTTALQSLAVLAAKLEQAEGGPASPGQPVILGGIFHPGDPTPTIENITITLGELHSMIVGSARELAELADELDALRPTLATAADPNRSAQAVRRAAVSIHLIYKNLCRQFAAALAAGE